MTLSCCSPRYLVLLLSVGFGLSCQLSGSAEQAPAIVSVEEDWELVVGTPDVNSVAPQVTCIMSPTGDFSSYTSSFELNHRSQPSFSAGGLHLHVWDGEIPVNVRGTHDGTTLSHDGETVCWTQSMSVVGGVLVVEVKDGSSTTWGTFGDNGNLKIVSTAAMANLNGYDPDFSTENSGVGYASNRVQSLVLRRVRLTTVTGEVLEDTTPRVVVSQN